MRQPVFCVFEESNNIRKFGDGKRKRPNAVFQNLQLSITNFYNLLFFVQCVTMLCNLFVGFCSEFFYSHLY